MKIQLYEDHGFKAEYVKKMEFLNKELSAEEVIRIMVKETLMPMDLKDGVVCVMHPQNY